MSLPDVHTTRPVLLSTAVPASPTFSSNRLPSTTGDPAKPHSGFFTPSPSSRFVCQITLPLAASKQSRCPRLLSVNTRSFSHVGDEPGPTLDSLWSSAQGYEYFPSSFPDFSSKQKTVSVSFAFPIVNARPLATVTDENPI